MRFPDESLSIHVSSPGCYFIDFIEIKRRRPMPRADTSVFVISTANHTFGKFFALSKKNSGGTHRVLSETDSQIKGSTRFIFLD
jgi:hypothetical protein